MTVSEQIEHFSKQFGKEIIVNKTTWRYYRLGTGTPIMWLTGGFRRAAFGYAFMKKLALRHTVIAPDYPPMKSIDEFFTAFDTILATEGLETFTLGGQSYGGSLAQAYLAHKGKAVKELILCSTGPANLSKIWLPAIYLVVALMRTLPEKSVKNFLANQLRQLISVPEAEHAEWMRIFDNTMQNDLSRADGISHFAVAADYMTKGIVTPTAYKNWTGRIIVLSAKNDPTQNKRDFPRYEELFGRTVEVIDMGDMGHTAAFSNPDKFVELLEQIIS